MTANAALSGDLGAIKGSPTCFNESFADFTPYFCLTPAPPVSTPFRTPKSRSNYTASHRPQNPYHQSHQGSQSSGKSENSTYTQNYKDDEPDTKADYCTNYASNNTCPSTADNFSL